MKNNKQRYMNLGGKVFALTILFLAIVACKDEYPDGPTPQLELKNNDFHVHCVKIYGGALGSDFGALHLKGYIKNNSQFRVELKASYKGSDQEVYTYFVDKQNGSRPVSEIYLDAGEEVSGSIMHIDEQPYLGVPAAMESQSGAGLFRVDAYPVDDKNQRLDNGNSKKYIVSVPVPEGFIETDSGRLQCPCISTEDCGDQTQGSQI